MISAGLDDLDIIGKGVSGLSGVIALAVALFLKQKFMDKKEEKSGRSSGAYERPISEWLGDFLEAMTEDRREMKELFREMASELRTIGAQGQRTMDKVDAVANAAARIESKADVLLQRRGP